MILLAITDGVTEALDNDCNPYGRGRVSAALSGARELGPKAVVRRILREVADHAVNGDDRTALALQFV